MLAVQIMNTGAEDEFVCECVTAWMKMQFLPHLKIKSFIDSSVMDTPSL